MKHLVILLALLLIPVSAAFATDCQSKDKATEAASVSADDHLAKCAEMMGMTIEECKAACEGMEYCNMRTISVTGMTCGGCESQVTAALEKVEGVKRVLKVDHKKGMAFVCVAKETVSDDALVSAIQAKGYGASMAVATAETGDVVPASAEGKPAGCAKTCASKASAEGCASQSKKEAKEETKDSGTR